MLYLNLDPHTSHGFRKKDFFGLKSKQGNNKEALMNAFEPGNKVIPNEDRRIKTIYGGRTEAHTKSSSMPQSP